MFNTQIFNTSVNIKPACTGILQKSHPNSFFKRFHKSSKCAEWVFSPNPCLKEQMDRYADTYRKYMDVIVLQVMSFGDEEFLCELVDSKVFEE